MGPGREYVIPLSGGPPVTYNLTVTAGGPVRLDLISLDEGVPTQDWGIGTYFSRTFTIIEGNWCLRVSNPSVNDTVGLEVTLLAEPGAAYPLPYLPRSLPYILPLVSAGSILVALGGALVKRDVSVLLQLRTERGFWACFLMPVLGILDALITYASISSYGLAVETNPVIVSLYQTGVWAILLFHSVTIVFLKGLSLSMYGLIVRSRLPKTSKLVVVALFSAIFGALSLLVLFSSLTPLRRLLPQAFGYGSATFFLIIGSPIVLSSTLATYLSTIIREDLGG
ncbi:MAG: hypothetical protein QW057_07455 [Candidatus Bathyarchaeia archaeon]